MIFFVAALSIVHAIECSVEWCCGKNAQGEPVPASECFVTNATVVNDTSTGEAYCECTCDQGWFSDPNDSEHCWRCNGHGLNYTSYDTWQEGCVCANHWTVGFPEEIKYDFFNGECLKCPYPFGGENCDQCAEGVHQASYPECNVCAEDYFKDTRAIVRTTDTEGKCLKFSDCNTDYCNAYDIGNENLGPTGVLDAMITRVLHADPTCTCLCKDGWFGNFEDDDSSESYHMEQAACVMCGGHGTAFDPNAPVGEKCTCSGAWTAPDPDWAGRTPDANSCDVCPLGVDEDHGCDQCEVGWTNYPDCTWEYVEYGYTFNWGVFWGIMIPVFVLTAGFTGYKRWKKRQEEGGDAYKFMV